MAVSNGCEAGVEDDWVLDSLDRYERLHVFELQDPTLCMEWNHDETAFYVAGFTEVRHNELLELLLPEKLLATDKQTLLARRDFKIGRGALCKQPIHHIQCIHQTNNVVTSGLSPELTVWGPDSQSPDLLVPTSNITTPKSNLVDPKRTELFISSVSLQPECLLTGSSLGTLQVIDLHTSKATWQYQAMDTILHGLSYLPKHPNTFLTCSGASGELTFWDSRQSDDGCSATTFTQSSLVKSSKEPLTVNDESRLYTMAIGGDKCARLSDTGELLMYDMRGSSSWQPLATCQLPTKSETFLYSQFTTIRSPARRHPCIQFSQSSNQISVSGLDKGVAVYDITSWSNDIINPTAVFNHTGHEADTPHCKVTVHSWHPSFHSMIVSCDTDGIMHAWQWNT